MAFTAFDDGKEWILDPTYGELRFRASEWGVYPNSTTYWHPAIILESHICSREELGLDKDGTNSKFLPINARS